jgi:hypothetical protein
LACAALTTAPAWAEEPPAPSTPAGPFTVLPSPPVLLADAPAEAPHTDAEPICTESRPGGLFLGAEYLLLKPQRGDLDYAILNATRSGHPDGTTETLVLPTVSSFRVEGGYRFPSQWDAGLAYSYLFSHGQSAVTTGANGTIYTTMTSPGGNVSEATSAIGDVRLNYNVGDLEIGRRLDFGETFGLRLFAGSRLGFINQHVSATYNGRDANFDGIFTRVDFSGAGVRIGAEGVCKVGGGFTMYARAAGSLLEGRYEVSESETNGPATLLNVADKFERVVPVTELGLGVGWERNNVRLRIGYEMTNWGSLVDRVDFVDDVHRGKLVHNLSDLSLSGLTLQLAFGF